MLQDWIGVHTHKLRYKIKPIMLIEMLLLMQCLFAIMYIIELNYCSKCNIEFIQLLYRLLFRPWDHEPNRFLQGPVPPLVTALAVPLFSTSGTVLALCCIISRSKWANAKDHQIKTKLNTKCFMQSFIYEQSAVLYNNTLVSIYDHF